MVHDQYAYEAMARVLYEEGTEKVFTLMSDATMGIVSTLDAEWPSADLEVVHTRHEQGAVAMADGYHRTTGKIGVCITGKGPALAHTGTALTNARKKGSNVLLIVPDAPLDRFYDNPVKRFDQDGYLQTTIGGAAADRNRYGNTDSVINIRSTNTLVEDFSEAIRRLHTGEGPIAVQVPSDVLNQKLDREYDWDEYERTSETVHSRPRLSPDDERIEAAIDLYLDSDATAAPVIIAGAGAVASGAQESITHLAERMNALIVTTMQSRGAFSDHPFSLGFIGTHGRNIANEYLVESDLVLATGCSLNEFTTDKNRLLGAKDDSTKIIQIDENTSNIGRYTPVDIGIVADAKLATEALDASLEAIGIDRDGEFWTDRVQRRIARGLEFMHPDSFETHEQYIDPRAVVTALNDGMPDDRVVIVESGHAKFWVLNGIDIHNVGDFLWTLDFSSIGQAVPVGIGAGTGTTDRTAFAFCGDAGFMMSLQEVETAVRHDVPIVITVINDSALGSEYHHLVRDGEYAESAVIGTPDIGAVARELGAEGYTVRGADDLSVVRERVSDPIDGPIVIDCKVIRDVEVKYSGH